MALSLTFYLDRIAGDVRANVLYLHRTVANTSPKYMPEIYLCKVVVYNVPYVIKMNMQRAGLWL